MKPVSPRPCGAAGKAASSAPRANATVDSCEPSTGSPVDEKALVARTLASQDMEAFGQLVRCHQGRLRLLLRKLTGSAARADDLAQDSFLHAWKKLHTYSGRGSFVGWLMKIGYTTFLQSSRSTRRHREVVDQVAQRAVSPPVMGASGEHSAELNRLLSVLTQQERDIVIMSYACGLSHREISEATGVPVGTVKSSIARGKEKIRSKFGIGAHDPA